MERALTLRIVLELKRALRISFFALVCAALTVAEEEQGLVENSPFIPADFTAPETRRAAGEPEARTAPPRNLEFRGVYELAGTVKVNIHDRDRGEGHWVRLNDGDADFLVTDFSKENDEVTLKKEGTVARLNLESSRESPGAPDGTPTEADAPRLPAPQSVAARRQARGPQSPEGPSPSPPPAPDAAHRLEPEAEDEPRHRDAPTPQRVESPSPRADDQAPASESPDGGQPVVRERTPEAEDQQDTSAPTTPRRPVRRVVVPRR